MSSSPQSRRRSHRIAQVITRMVPGGASNVLRQIVAGLSDRYRMDLITGPEDCSIDSLRQMRGVHRVHVVPSLVRDIRPVKDLTALWELRRVFARESYDLVHLHTTKAGFLGRLACGGSSRPRVVYSPHGLIYAPGSRIEGVPRGGFGREILRWLERGVGRFHDLMITLSRHERDRCTRMGLSAPYRTVAVPNGIDVESFRPRPGRRRRVRRRYGIEPDELLILSVGRLAPEKGHDVLVDAFRELHRQHPRTRLLIAGEGPRRRELERRAGRDLTRGIIQMPGHVEDVPPLYSGADLFVLPSRYEGFGLALLEAMSAGLPVVATRVGGVPELVGEPLKESLVKPGDPASMVRLLRRLVQHESLRERQARAGQKRSDRFSLGRMLRVHRKLYDRLLNGAARGFDSRGRSGGQPRREKTSGSVSLIER